MAGGNHDRPGFRNDFESERPSAPHDIVDISGHVSAMPGFVRSGRKSNPVGDTSQCGEDPPPGLFGSDAELGRNRLRRPPPQESKHEQETHLGGQAVEQRVERGGYFRSAKRRASHARDSISLDPVMCYRLESQIQDAFVHHLDQLRQLKVVRRVEQRLRCRLLTVGAIARPAKAGPVGGHQPTLEDLGTIRIRQSANHCEMGHRNLNYAASLRNTMYVTAARSWFP